MPSKSAGETDFQVAEDSVIPRFVLRFAPTASNVQRDAKHRVLLVWADFHARVKLAELGDVYSGLVMVMWMSIIFM